MFRDPNLCNKLRDNFEKDFNFAQQKTFFGLKKEQLFNERYFHSIFIKSLNEIDPSIKLIIPEMPYPKKINMPHPKKKIKRMDIFIPANNNIEVKYFREAPAGGGQTEERGRLYADFFKLALLSKENSNYFLFFIFDQKRWDFFSKNSFRGEFDQRQRLIMENGNIINNFVFTHDLLYHGKKVKSLRKTIESEIDGSIKFNNIKINIDQLFQFQYGGFYFYFLQFKAEVN